MADSKASRKKLVAAERRIQALDLRKAGATYQQIGRQLGYSEQRAHQIVTSELQRLNTERSEAATEVRRLELERLDAMLLGAWPRGKSGDPKMGQFCLAIMDRRARLLGLDAPTKVAPTDPSGQNPYVSKSIHDLTDAELEALAEKARQVVNGGDSDQDE